MQMDYKNYQIIKYTLNIMNNISLNHMVSKIFTQWFEEKKGLFLFLKVLKNKKTISKNDWLKIKEEITTYVSKIKKPKLGITEKNIKTIANELDLDDTSIDILIFSIILEQDEVFSGFILVFCKECSIKVEHFLLMVLGLDKKDLNKIKNAMQTLYDIGVFDRDYNCFDPIFNKIFRMDRDIFTSILPPNRGKKDIYKFLFTSPAKASLNWSDFEYLKKERDLIFNLIKGAYETNEKAINVLLYGNVGVGKTEFSKTVAHKLKKQIYCIGEERKGDEPEREYRLSKLLLANKLLSKQKKSILLFDEMEDAFSSSFFKPSSKVFMNRLLENNKIPTIWICNNIDNFESHFLRRFTLIVEMKNPSIETRKKIWQKILKKHRLNLPEKDVLNLVLDNDLTPAVIENSAKITRLAKVKFEDSIKIVSDNLKLALKRKNNLCSSENVENNYKHELENTDFPLDFLTTKILDSKKNFSICLYGASGTGKSFYVRYLAKQMGLNILEKRNSELLSMLVGESEKNIANAFYEAEKNNMFLVFDEVDSLLRNRGNAHNSWEITQVNEMLTFMERHPLPFACTTNFIESLDSASLRRFTFKIKYNFLNNTQCYLAYKIFFKHNCDNNIIFPNNLTPGDFALVAKKAEILDCVNNNKALLDMLNLESNSKPNSVKNPIGFVV